MLLMHCENIELYTAAPSILISNLALLLLAGPAILWVLGSFCLRLEGMKQLSIIMGVLSTPLMCDANRELILCYGETSH
jgi:hypothetical protein